MSAPAIVTAPPRLSPRRLAPALAALLAAAAATAGTLALTHGSRVPARPEPSTGALIQGANLQSARCAHWVAATPAERGNAIAALSASVGGPTEFGSRGTTLTTSEANQLLDNACSNRMAKHFLLYELYIRAAAFHSQTLD